LFDAVARRRRRIPEASPFGYRNRTQTWCIVPRPTVDERDISPGEWRLHYAHLTAALNKAVEIDAGVLRARAEQLVQCNVESSHSAAGFPGSARALACWLRRLAATSFFETEHALAKIFS